MEQGGNMKSVFERFCRGLKLVEKAIESKGYEFAWNEHLGYVLTCPSNLGTGTNLKATINPWQGWFRVIGRRKRPFHVWNVAILKRSDVVGLFIVSMFCPCVLRYVYAFLFLLLKVNWKRIFGTLQHD